MSTFPAIGELVPHRPPMILLDRMLDYAAGHARCAVQLRDDSPFVEDGRVRALVAIEYMAQAVAAYAGMRSREKGERPSIGFLLGTRELRLPVDFFQAGDALLVDVEHLFGDEQLGSFRCVVRRGDEMVGEAVLSVYQMKPGESLRHERAERSSPAPAAASAPPSPRRWRAPATR